MGETEVGSPDWVENWSHSDFLVIGSEKHPSTLAHDFSDHVMPGKKKKVNKPAKARRTGHWRPHIATAAITTSDTDRGKGSTVALAS